MYDFRADYLTMTSEGKPKFTVAVAVDGSAFSKDALKFYLERLHKPDNQVLLVYANEPIARGEMMLVVGVAQYGSVSPDMWRRIMVQRQNQWKAMKQDIQSLIPAEVAYTWSSTEECGDAGEHIVQTAEQNGCSMIVVGTRGLGTIRRTILGSVSDYVVHHSAIPVFVCKHK